MSFDNSVRLSSYILSAVVLGGALQAGTIDSSGFGAGTTLINFDDLTGADCNLCGPSVTNQYASRGVIFDNPSFPGKDTADTNLTSGIPDASMDNALFVDQGGHISDSPAMPFQIVFSVPVTSVGFNYGSSSDSFLCVAIYASDNSLLDTQTYMGDPTWLGLGGFAGIQESTPIARVDLSYHPLYDPGRTFNFSIDNLRFESSPVPEPTPGPTVGLSLIAIALWSCRATLSRRGQ